MLASSGCVAAVDAALCADHCQFAALSVDGSQAMVDLAACMGCGACVSQCPPQAICLRRDPTKGKPLEIQRLIAEAATTARN